MVDLDLEKFFDRVNHDKLMVRIAERISDKRLLKLIRAFLSAKLKLKVNSEKSTMAQPWQRKFLGFSFTNAGIPKRRIAPQAVDRFRARVRELTRRRRGVSTERMAEELARYLRGWIGYFGACEARSVLQALDSWLRRRLRSAIWKRWKRNPARFAELRQRGVSLELTAQTVASAHGPWHLANSPALSIALPNAYFDSLGISRLLIRASSTNRTAVYGPVRTVV